jgi:hypothetical protein
LIDAVVEMKRRNPTWGCPRIAQQITLAFSVDIDKDVVRRILGKHYGQESGSGSPSWLNFLGIILSFRDAFALTGKSVASARSRWRRPDRRAGRGDFTLAHCW